MKIFKEVNLLMIIYNSSKVIFVITPESFHCSHDHNWGFEQKFSEFSEFRNSERSLKQEKRLI